MCCLLSSSFFFGAHTASTNRGPTVFGPGIPVDYTLRKRQNLPFPVQYYICSIFITSFLPLSHWKLISKLISKLTLISSFCKKISSVNSQLSKEQNFLILFRNLQHVLFCKISQKKFCLWSALIGQSASVYKH